MRTTSDVVYDITGQTLAHRVLQGRPTSATFKVFRDTQSDDETAEFEGTATVDSVSTTLTAASGRGQTDPNKVNMTTTNVVTGRKYLISEGQMKEWFEPIQVETGYARGRYPLRNAFTTAATVVGTTITAAVDSTWVADESNISNHLDPNPDYRVRWEIVVGSDTLVEYSFFDLVRATIGTGVDIFDLNDRAPGLHDSLPIEYRPDQGQSLIAAALRSVQAELGADSIDIDAIRDVQVLDELVILRALNMLAIGGWRPKSYASLVEYIDATGKEYARFYEKNFKAALSRRMDAGTTGAAETVALPYVYAK